MVAIVNYFSFFWDESGGDLAAVMQSEGRYFGSLPEQWEKQLLAERDSGLDQILHFSQTLQHQPRVSWYTDRMCAVLHPVSPRTREQLHGSLHGSTLHLP